MQYIFTNGTAHQKALMLESVGYLLNLPEDSIGLTVTVTFQPTVSGQTDFALTEWTYDSHGSQQRIRSDAPGFGALDGGLEEEAARWGLEYSPTKHFHETTIHELGHSAFAALEEKHRLEICAMFGVKTDDASVINNPALAWQDRIAEGIAETFKEAFLPARFRVFPNRSNRKIPYSEYPRFRRIFREGLAMGEEHFIEAVELQIVQIEQTYFPVIS